MDQHELNDLKRWFADYCRSFYSSDREDQRNIALKEEHTYRVCENIVQIARSLSLRDDEVVLSEGVALFHDVGRFLQYQEFKTFRDSISVNHAALGAKVLIESNVLRDLPRNEQHIIIRSVALHNVYTIPSGIDRNLLVFLKLVRDADKLDIWRVAIEYYGQPEESKASAVGLGLQDAPAYSPDVLSALANEQMVQMNMLKTLNDFKLLQLSWIFDLNTTCSLQMVIEKEYIDNIASTLPKTIEIEHAVDRVRKYVDQRIARIKVESSPAR